MQAKKVKNLFYLGLYVLPLFLLPIIILSYNKDGITFDFNTIVLNLENCFKIDFFYNILKTSLGYLSVSVVSGSFISYSLSYLSYYIVIYLTDILLDVLLLLPKMAHDFFDRRAL